MVLQCTGTNAAYQLTLVLASVTNSLIAMSMMRRDALDDNDYIRKANDGLHGQAAMSLLLQCSRRRQHTELAYLFFTWRMAFSRSSICGATTRGSLLLK